MFYQELFIYLLYINLTVISLTELCSINWIKNKNILYNVLHICKTSIKYVLSILKKYIEKFIIGLFFIEILL